MPDFTSAPLLLILTVVLANAVIGFVQEGKAEAAMAAIRTIPLSVRQNNDGQQADTLRRMLPVRRHRPTPEAGT